MEVPKRLVISGLFVIVLLLWSGLVFQPAYAGTGASSPDSSTGNKSGVWAGWGDRANDGAVSGIFVSFVQPKATCDTNLHAQQQAYFLAGIDGLPGLLHFRWVGTIATCLSGSKTPTYAAASTGSDGTIQSLQISAGDVIEANITVVAGNLVYNLTDVTTRQSATDESSASGVNLAAAECVVSLGGNEQGALPLARFSDAQFGTSYTGVPGTCYATINGATNPIGKVGTGAKFVEYKMYAVVSRRTHLIAVPSPLDTDRASFTVRWKGSGS